MGKTFKHYMELFDCGLLPEDEYATALKSGAVVFKKVFDDGYNLVRHITRADSDDEKNMPNQRLAMDFFRLIADRRTWFERFSFAVFRKVPSLLVLSPLISCWEYICKSIHNLNVFYDGKYDNVYAQCERTMAFYTEVAHTLYGAKKQYYTPKIQAEGTAACFAWCIQMGGFALNRFFKAQPKQDPLWFNMYSYLRQNSVEDVNRDLDVVGQYICRHFDEQRVRQAVYYNNFFECIALHWAFENGRLKEALEIVNNGYDNYLEIETMYFLYKYAREELRKKFVELKTVCLKRNLKLIKKAHTYVLNIFKIYDSNFLSDLRWLLETELKSYDTTDLTNPRNDATKHIPAEFL